MKDRVFQWIDQNKDCFIEMGDQIFDHPEWGCEEVYAVGLLTDYLKNAGFSVETGVGGFETAFRAVYENGSGGPVIGILCEYDALKNLGHGCGHHMQGPSCLAAAVALKECMKDQAFQLVVYGTPAEETIGAKCKMLENGCFRELDVAFMMHGGPNTSTDIKCLAQKAFDVSFFGKRAHAALAPDKGKSALDAMLAAFNGVEFLREHMPDDVRMHYTITQLPGPANVIPARADGEFCVRSFSSKTLEEAEVRLREIIQGAALIAGVTYEITQKSNFFNKVPVLILNELLMENAKLAGAPQLAPPREKTGSTDFGNVMHEIPGSCIRVAFVPEGTPSHSPEYLEAGKTEAAHNCILYGAKAIAGAVTDILTDDGMMDRIKAEFAKNKEIYA